MERYPWRLLVFHARNVDHRDYGFIVRKYKVKVLENGKHPDDMENNEEPSFGGVIKDLKAVLVGP